MLLWIIHRNHGLTNHLGKAFIQHARIKENADPNMGAEQLLSAAVDSVSFLIKRSFQAHFANFGNIVDGNTQVQPSLMVNTLRGCWAHHLRGLKCVQSFKYKKVPMFYLLPDIDLLASARQRWFIW